MYDVTEWKHVFKLDPNKDLPDEQLEILCESGTDAVIIGGSDGVTEDNVLRMMSKVRRFLVPCVLEVSAIEAIVPGFDLYFIPSVLNSKNADWIVGMHQKAMKEYGELMSMEEIVAEGYCIANPDCKAAALTEADADLNMDDIVAYARVSEPAATADFLFRIQRRAWRHRSCQENEGCIGNVHLVLRRRHQGCGNGQAVRRACGRDRYR